VLTQQQVVATAVTTYDMTNTTGINHWRHETQRVERSQLCTSQGLMGWVPPALCAL